MSFFRQAKARAALARVEQDYARHQQAAREIARNHFDANKVLADLFVIAA